MWKKFIFFICCCRKCKKKKNNENGDNQSRDGIKTSNNNKHLSNIDKEFQIIELEYGQNNERKEKDNGYEKVNGECQHNISKENNPNNMKRTSNKNYIEKDNVNEITFIKKKKNNKRNDIIQENKIKKLETNYEIEPHCIGITFKDENNIKENSELNLNKKKKENYQDNKFNDNLINDEDEKKNEKYNKENKDIKENDKEKEINNDNSTNLILEEISNKSKDLIDKNEDNLNEKQDNKNEEILKLNNDINNKNNDYLNNKDVNYKKEDLHLENKINNDANDKTDDNSNNNDINYKKEELHLENKINNDYTNDDIKFSSLISLSEKEKEKISLGINIGAFKTVYSIFKKINQKYLSNVLLMNDSSRIIPSIICYSKTHRLYGDNSISSLKRNLKTSYNNISRLICYEENNDFNRNEFKYNFNIENHLEFNNYEGENLIKINSDYLISDYLSLINCYYFEKNQVPYDLTSLSVPDFYTFTQKKKLKLICESINLNNVKIYNESSAITMYYGYIKYKDLFVIESNNISKTIFKYILFIDSGHSKTNFVLSKFKYNKFSVEYVESMSELGGRNFDELLVKYCFEEFKKSNDLDIEMTDIIKYKLSEEIQKSRIKLTVNSETLITIDALYEDYDLVIEITKNKFEEIIKDYLQEFSNTLQKVIQYSKENNFIIDYVEIAGELMRTPIIQQILIDNKLTISKTILIDECTSVGASILRSFEIKDFPLKELKIFEFYNYNEIRYEIENFNDVLFPKGKIIDRKKRIDLKDFISDQQKCINIKFYLSENMNNNYNDNLIDDYLVEYKIDLFNQFRKNLIFEIEIDEELNFINGKLISDKNEIMIKDDENIKSGLIYNINKEKNNFLTQNRNYINSQKIKDHNYDLFVSEKSNISKLIYKVKAIIDNKNLYNEKIIIQDLDRRLRNLNNNKNGDLEIIRNELNEIYNKFTD